MRFLLNKFLKSLNIEILCSLTLIIPGHTEFPHIEKEGQSTGREGNSKGKSHPWKRIRGLGEAEICCKIEMKKTRSSVYYMLSIFFCVPHI